MGRAKEGEAMTTGHVASTRIKLLPRLSALLVQKIAARNLHIDKENCGSSLVRLRGLAESRSQPETAR